MQRETFIPLAHDPGQRLEADFGPIQLRDPLHDLAALGRRPAALDHAPVLRDWQWPECFTQWRPALERRHGPRPGARQSIRVLQLLEAAQKQDQLDRRLAPLDKADLLICDERGSLSFSRAGAERLFQVVAARDERRSLLITSNLACSEWGQVFPGERMTAALLDRLTHRCQIIEMNGEGCRCRESMKSQKAKKGE